MVFGAAKPTVDANDVFFADSWGFDLHTATDAENPVATTCFSDRGERRNSTGRM